MTHFGAVCFVSDNRSLHGEIKSKSSDFEVHEIDLEGNVAGIDICNPAFKKIKISATEKGVVNKVAECKDNKKNIRQEGEIPVQVWNCISSDVRKHVVDIIGVEKLESIKQIKKYETTKLSLDLGVFCDKNERHILHQCIRYSFPFLVTKTSKLGNETRMACCVDMLYGAMLGIGLTEKMAGDFIRYVNCRSLWQVKNPPVDSLNIDVTDFEKSKRKELHNFIHKNYGKILESKTINGDQQQTFISVRFKERKQGVRKRKRDLEDIVVVTLWKDNLELLQVLQMLSSELDVRLSDIKYAGIKDKKAVTYQFISISGTTLKRVRDVVEKQPGGWHLTDSVSASSHLQLGDLTGNKFKILIRNLKIAPATSNGFQPPNIPELRSTMKQSASNLLSSGFINYFGEQRFGHDQSAARIGLALLQKDYACAVDLLLSPKSLFDSEQNELVEMSKICFAKTHDAKEALKTMPYRNTRERLVLQALNRHSYSKEGCLKAFLNIPYAMRMFYVHSYCSLVWNKVITDRITKHGFEVLPGDLVSEGGEKRILVKDDIRSESFTISDILLPLPGMAVILPENDCKDTYTNLLRMDSIECDSFKMKELGFNIQGSYRKVITKPTNVSWELCDGSSVKNDESHDMLLEFHLPSSSYATMLIRELMHDKN